MKKYLKYTHPAMTMYDLNKLYTLEELKADGLTTEQILMLFSYVDVNGKKEEVVEIKVEKESKVIEEVKEVKETKK